MKKTLIEEAARVDRANEKPPVTSGMMTGPSMTIAWSLWEADRESMRSPVDLAIEFTPDPATEKTFLVEGRVHIDAIWVAKAIDPKAWNEVLVQAATMVVADAATRDARLRAKVSAPRGEA